MEIIKNKRLLAIIGICGLLLGIFLAYFKISLWIYSETISLWGYWEGKVVLVLTLANALYIFNDFIEKYIPQLFNNGVGRLVKKANNPKFSLIPTVLVAVFAIYMIISIDVSSEYIKYGIGFYILWVGILALIGHAIFYKKPATINEQNNINMVNNSQTTVEQNINIPVQNVNTPVQNVGTKFCTQCGNPMNMTDMVCSKCGKNF